MAQSNVNVGSRPTSPSLKTSFSWAFIGNATNAACQWLVLIVLAKLGSPEMLGQWALAVAVSSPVFLLTNLQLRSVQATDARGIYSLRDYLTLRLPTLGVAVATIGAISLFAKYDKQILTVILVYSLGKSFDWISDIFYGKMQREDRMDLVAKGMLTNSIMSLLFFAVTLLITQDLLWSAVSYAFVSLAVLVLYSAPSGLGLARAEHVDSDRSRWRPLLKLAWITLPLGLVSCLSSLSTFVPQYTLEYFSGVKELGVYSALAYIAFAGQTVTGALGQSAAPRLSRFYAGNDTESFRSLLYRLLAVAMFMGGTLLLVVIIAGEDLIRLLYSETFAIHRAVLITMTVATAILFVASVLGTAATAMRSFRPQLAVHCVNLVMVSSISLLTVPSIGLQGAAWAMLLGAITLCIGYAWVIRRLSENQI